MARIGIDATAVSPAGKGNSRGQRRAIEALRAIGFPHELVAFVGGREAEDMLARTGVRCLHVLHGPALVWELVGIERAVARHELDAVLTMSERLPLAGRGRYVVWFWELPHHRAALNRRERAGMYQVAADLVTLALWKRSLRRAAVVVAGSHATAREVAEAIPELAGRMPVIYPGLDKVFQPGPVPEAQHYVLHLSSSDPRDNTETALEAFARASPRLREPARLKIVGSLGSRSVLIEQTADRLGIRALIDLVGWVPDHELVRLYQGAAVYLDPSRFEGFGYQFLEAMGCGAPVVGSNVTSVPEVVGDAGLLFDPDDAAGLADALVRVLEDPELGGELRRKGLERAAGFSWERTARALADVIEGVL